MSDLSFNDGSASYGRDHGLGCMTHYVCISLSAFNGTNKNLPKEAANS